MIESGNKNTISSVDVRDDVRSLAEDLSPWPISNEEAWFVIESHLGPLRRRISLLEASVKHQERIIDHYEKERDGKNKGTRP